jgi:hypothetical protein
MPSEIYEDWFTDDDSDESFEENVIDTTENNVGLTAERYKYIVGVKGQLTTTHCFPRKLKNPTVTLASKLKKDELEMKEFIQDFLRIQAMNKDTADGILIGLIFNSDMTKKEAVHNFKIDSPRWRRLVKKTAAKGHGLNGQQILPEELEHFHDLISSLAVEWGYPCNHRKMVFIAKCENALIEHV